LTVNFLLGISIVFISMHQVIVAFYYLAHFLLDIYMSYFYSVFLSTLILVLFLFSFSLH